MGEEDNWEEKHKKRENRENVQEERGGVEEQTNLLVWNLKLRDLRISEMTLDCDVIEERNASDREFTGQGWENWISQ